MCSLVTGVQTCARPICFTLITSELRRQSDLVRSKSAEVFQLSLSPRSNDLNAGGEQQHDSVAYNTARCPLDQRSLPRRQLRFVQQHLPGRYCDKRPRRGCAKGEGERLQGEDRKSSRLNISHQ